MFTRLQMKSAAKLNLSRNWGRAIAAFLFYVLPAIAVSVIAQVIQVFAGIGAVFIGAASENYNSYGDFSDYAVSGVMVIFLIIIAVLSIIIGICVSPVSEVGLARYLLKTRGTQTPTAAETFAPFKEGCAGNIIGARFVTNIIIFFASLCFFIPGILLALKYAMVPYILASDASIKGSDARELSAKMMKDHWAELFVLYLSFFGWFLLCAFPFVIFYVMPYYYATMIEFYSCRRAELIAQGALSPVELPSFGADWYSPYNPDGPFGSFGFAPPPEDAPPVI